MPKTASKLTISHLYFTYTKIFCLRDLGLPFVWQYNVPPEPTGVPLTTICMYFVLYCTVLYFVFPQNKAGSATVNLNLIRSSLFVH